MPCIATISALYPSLDYFYRDEKRRSMSPEAQYGVHWQLPGWSNNWTISYIQRTGEIYAVYQGPETPIVVVLGKQPPDPPDPTNPGLTWYRSLDLMLDGYAELERNERTLYWIKERLARTAGRNAAADTGGTGICINCGHTITAPDIPARNELASEPYPQCGPPLW